MEEEESTRGNGTVDERRGRTISPWASCSQRLSPARRRCGWWHSFCNITSFWTNKVVHRRRSPTKERKRKERGRRRSKVHRLFLQTHIAPHAMESWTPRRRCRRGGAEEGHVSIRRRVVLLCCLWKWGLLVGHGRGLRTGKPGWWKLIWAL